MVEDDPQIKPKELLSTLMGRAGEALEEASRLLSRLPEDQVATGDLRQRIEVVSAQLVSLRTQLEARMDSGAVDDLDGRIQELIAQLDAKIKKITNTVILEGEFTAPSVRPQQDQPSQKAPTIHLQFTGPPPKKKEGVGESLEELRWRLIKNQMEGGIEPDRHHLLTIMTVLAGDGPLATQVRKIKNEIDAANKAKGFVAEVHWGIKWKANLDKWKQAIQSGQVKITEAEKAKIMEILGIQGVAPASEPAPPPAPPRPEPKPPEPRAAEPESPPAVPVPEKATTAQAKLRQAVADARAELEAVDPEEMFQELDKDGQRVKNLKKAVNIINLIINKKIDRKPPDKKGLITLLLIASDEKLYQQMASDLSRQPLIDSYLKTKELVKAI